MKPKSSRSVGLSIVIVHYRSPSELEICLRSIEACPMAVGHEICVVDNRSQDEAVAMVRRAFPYITVVESEQNVGFGRAVNEAASRTSGAYVLVLNPDIVVQPGSIERLYGYMESHPDVALCAPRLLNQDGTVQYSCRTDYSLGVYLLRRTPLGRWCPKHRIIREHLMTAWDHATTRDVDWVLGAAFMFRRGAFQTNQVMDERFFLYFEDVDLCLRLRRAGWRVVYNPDSVMVHAHQRASAGGLISRAKVEHLKSWLKFEWKHRVAGRWADRGDRSIVRYDRT
ncbi:MAG: glycosyltransferase family 2 protein [Nitrospiraceae bacterium]